jgi:hypothetical protein
MQDAPVPVNQPVRMRCDAILCDHPFRAHALRITCISALDEEPSVVGSSLTHHCSRRLVVRSSKPCDSGINVPCRWGGAASHRAHFRVIASPRSPKRRSRNEERGIETKTVCNCYSPTVGEEFSSSKRRRPGQCYICAVC